MYIVIHKPAVCKDMRENSFKTYFKNFNYVRVFVYILGACNIKKEGYSSFLRLFTVVFPLFLDHVGALTLRGQLSNLVGQSPNPI